MNRNHTTNPPVTESREQQLDCQLAVRIGFDLLGRIDGYLDGMKRQHPGARLTRSDAIRDLVERALPRDAAPAGN
jgi:hypothetical protein